MNYPIAALVYQDNGDSELNTLYSAIEQLRARDLKVAGLINKRDEQGRKLTNYICSISDGREYNIMYDDGCTADACKLNPRTLAESSEVIREALDNPPDILVINKFGHAESEGCGLIDEFSQAVSSGIPVISLVQKKYFIEWQQFTDGIGLVLDNKVEAVLDWAEKQLQKA